MPMTQQRQETNQFVNFVNLTQHVTSCRFELILHTLMYILMYIQNISFLFFLSCRKILANRLLCKSASSFCPQLLRSRFLETNLVQRCFEGRECDPFIYALKTANKVLIESSSPQLLHSRSKRPTQQLYKLNASLKRFACEKWLSRFN